MTERYSFAVDRHLVDGSVVWNQDNIENSTLTDTINEGYVTAEEDSPTRYLSVLDSTTDISLENLNITLTNPKLEEEEQVETYEEQPVEQTEENNDQVVVFSVEGSDELFGIQIVQDEEGNLQKYQFQFRKNDDGQLEAIPETITLLPLDDEEETQTITSQLDQETEYAQPVETHSLQIYVHEDNSQEHILPDNGEETQMPEIQQDSTTLYESEADDQIDIKPGILQLQNVKQEMQEAQVEYSNELMETQTFTDNLENQIGDLQEAENFEYNSEITGHSEDNSMSSEMHVDFPEKDIEPQPQDEDTMNTESSEAPHDEESEFTTMNDSDENDYEIVEGVHITGDVDNGVVSEEQVDKPQHTNILKHALKVNKESSKIVKKDNKLYLYVVQHPEKENVDSLSYEMSNLCKPKVNPRSILKSSHAMFQGKNEIESDGQDERYNKRFARCKEAVQAMLFHNFINKTTIPQAPVRQQRLPRKQKIKPVERMDEEIVVKEVMVSNNGFVEAGSGAANNEMVSVTDYVELTDSDDDYDPKRVNRKKKKHRRKRVEITISDDESSDSHDSVIELDESDEEEEEGANNNNTTPPKRRRGRPPKNKSLDSPTSNIESPSKKSKFETIESKPEIPCPKCEKTFPSQNSLKTHLQHHNLQSSMKKSLPEYKYKCDKCATTFINNILLKKHMCSKLFNCSVCKKKFPDFSSLNGHKRTHAKEQMVKSTTVQQVSPKKVKPVQPTAFKVPKATKCKTCGKLCSSIQNLNIHMKTHKEFTCGTCSKSFLSQLMLEKHVRESCVKSPQSNRRSIRIRSHSSLEKTPPKLKTTPSKNLRLSFVRVKCDKCLLQFNNHKALFKHKVVVHGLETPDKSVLEQEDVKGPHGVPAAKRLQNAYAGLNCQLDFDS